jgi:hypothetical protein
MCTICEKSVAGAWDGLIDLGLHAPEYPNSYLMQCPHCSAYWMGHGFTPHLMLELTRAEAADVFRELEKALSPHLAKV